jgi:hypothetical protein
VDKYSKYRYDRGRVTVYKTVRNEIKKNVSKDILYSKFID